MKYAKAKFGVQYKPVIEFVRTVPNARTFNKIYYNMNREVHSNSYNKTTIAPYIFVWSYVRDEIFYSSFME